MTKPPFHTLPRADLLAVLDRMTNVRVVRDQDSRTDWSQVLDPFPGWETVPEW
jgi:hypothetical protein